MGPGVQVINNKELFFLWKENNSFLKNILEEYSPAGWGTLIALRAISGGRVVCWGAGSVSVH